MFQRLCGHVRRQWFFNLVQIAAVAIIIYWCWHLPSSPGYAIGVLAFLAAVMSLHVKMYRWEKAIWMLLIGALLVIEFYAIRKDRVETAKAEACRTASEHQQFQNIVNGLKESIENSNRQFAATESRFNETLNTMTGNGSYCYFTFNLDGNPRLVHKGKYTLYDLRSIFLDAKRSFIVGTEWEQGTPIVIGDFSVGSGRLISGVNKPSDFNSTDQLNLRIFFGARNGFWREEYRGRYVNKDWVEAIRIFKENGAPLTQKDTLIFEKIDKRFPRDKNGSVTWN
jgi:hypothetical protein